MTSVLVLRRGGLGDTLLLLPTLRALRRQWPAATLHFAGVRDFAAIFATHGVVDGIASSEDLELWSPERARARLAGHTHIVSDEARVATLAARGADVQVLSLQPHGEQPFGRHLAEQLGLALRWPTDAWLLPPRPMAKPGPVLLAPGSGARSKCWPPPCWLELSRWLVASGAAVQVVVGPTEIERDDPRGWPWPTGTDFVCEHEPTELASKLVAASAFVGNDSGPSHLAAMLAVPTVAIFGATDPRIWAPVGPQVAVVQASDLEAVTVPMVAAAWRSLANG